MNTNVKKCLFGGALLGAGLCSTATAGDFQWGSSGTYDNLLNLRPGGYSYFSTSGNWNESVIGTQNQYASSVGTDMGLSMLAYSGYASPNGQGYAYAKHYQGGYGGSLDFTVSADMTVYLDWDVSNDNYSGGYGLSFASITDSMGSIFSMNGSNATGNTSLAMVAGETYNFTAWIIAGPGVTGLSFFNMTGNNINVVPIPPAAFGGLAMLAGLGAYRRIRK